MISLEDAYLKIVKAESGANFKDDDQIQNEYIMQKYQSTTGESSFFGQLFSMTARRLIVFTREPRQWFLTVSPFINVCIAFLIIYSFFSLNGVDNETTKKVLSWLIAIMFPYLLNAGFASTTGVYMLMPIEERMNKTRHILKLGGLQTVPYWLGLLAADYLLFLIPTALFAIMVGAFNIPMFSSSMVQFIFGMLTFGFAVITFTYFISSFFDNQNSAIKCNVLIQLVIGTMLPYMLISLISTISNSGKVVEWSLTLFYVTDPMFTFYTTNYLLVIKWVNDQIPPD